MEMFGWGGVREYNEAAKSLIVLCLDFDICCIKWIAFLCDLFEYIYFLHLVFVTPWEF